MLENAPMSRILLGLVLFALTLNAATGLRDTDTMTAVLTGAPPAELVETTASPRSALRGGRIATHTS